VTRDIRGDLEAAGRRSAPSPRPGFTADLEQRLLAVARSADPDGARSPDGSPPPRRRQPLGVATGLVTVFVVFAVTVGVARLGDRPSGSYELTHAVNVEVALADGTTLVDPNGLVLPDAAIVTIGPGGSARIGDVTLSAGDVATVVGSDLRVDHSGRSDVAEASGSAGSTFAPTPSPRSASPPPATPTGSSTPAATTKPAPTDRPATPRPDGTPAKTNVPTGSPAQSAATPKSPPTSVDVKPLKLAARRVGPSEVGALWSGTPGARRYVLRGSSATDGPATDPVHPGSPIIGAFTRPPTEPLVFRVGKDVVEIRLLVVALDGDGVEIGRSNIATVSFVH
jgi:hypothetical protein